MIFLLLFRLFFFNCLISNFFFLFPKRFLFSHSFCLQVCIIRKLHFLARVGFTISFSKCPSLFLRKLKQRVTITKKVRVCVYNLFSPFFFLRSNHSHLSTQEQNLIT
uniref:(northern house mosquito) hypothetical protein n=1 Tax=Culex pipiens TaxID=7175 RepID=A0A8D8NAC0_CULPI